MNQSAIELYALSLQQ